MGIFDATNNRTTTTGGVAPYAQPYAQDLLKKTWEVANAPYTPSPSQYVGPGVGLQNAWQNTVDTVNAGAAKNPYANYNNPQLTKQIKDAQGDLASSWNNVQKPAWEGVMANSGSYGNTGVMQATGRAQEDLSRAMGDIASDMRFNAYNTAAGLQENFANRSDAFRQWGSGALNHMGGQQQGFNDKLAGQNYKWWEEAQNHPIRGLNEMRNSLGIGGGTSSTTNSPGPSPAGQFAGGALTAGSIYGAGREYGWW